MKLISQVKAALGARSATEITAEARMQRNLGDAARDRRDWQAAADHYDAYLKAKPRDFGIWVQSGHALKEAGRFAEAETSYAAAQRLKPDDTDLLVNFGHLKKMRRDYSGAARLYGEAARLSGGGPALVELASSLLAEHLTPGQREQIIHQTQAALAPLCKGLRLLNSSDLVPLGDDRFAFSSDRPWVEMAPVFDDPFAMIGELELRIEPLSPERPVEGRLFFDYGDGYRDEHSLALPSPENGQVLLRLAAPGLIRSMRWAPDRKTNEVRLSGISLTPRPDIDEVLVELREAYPADLPFDEELTAIRRRLLRGDFDGDSAIATSLMMGGGLERDPLDYGLWLRRWVNPTPADYRRIAELTEALPVKPRFSFVMPVYNPPPALLAECLDSLLGQTYADFEICIADDKSPNLEIRRMLERYAARDARIKIAFREHNGHISAASNSALALASGDFIVLVDHDDLVPDYALFVVAHYVNRHPEAQILFSDEDKITAEGRRYDPYFKGDFDPFLMFGHNMVSHLGVYRRDLIEAIGGFRHGLEGSQDYDLVLRAVEKAGAASVVHIPHILYHWRAIPGSTALSGDEKSYAVVAAQHAVNGHFERTGLPLRSIDGAFPGVNAVKADRRHDQLISIIIPTRDGVEDLQACIESIRASDHERTEILIVDNGSEDLATLAYLDQIARDDDVRVLAYPHPFNFSEINNFAVEHARGEVLCFLNNDTEVIASNWLSRARGLLAVPEVGIVGARLLYPDRTLQHFGVIVGMAAHGVAGHAYHGLPETAGGYFGKALLLQQFSAVTAACLFIRADLFREVGGFDPGLRVAYNDVDLCLKVRAAGHSVICDPELLLSHKESKTRGSDAGGAKAARLESEAAVMRERWADQLDHDPFYSPNHDLEHGNFRPANPPRVPMPWRGGEERDHAPAPSVFTRGRGYVAGAWAARPSAPARAVEGPFARRAATADFGLAILVGDRSSEAAIESAASLTRQTVAPAKIAFVIDPTTPAATTSALKANGLGPVLKAGSSSFNDRLAAASKGLATARVMLIPAGDALEPEAVERLNDAFGDGVGIAYCDELKLGDAGADVISLHPRPAFSLESYLSRPYFDRGVAFDRAAVEAVLREAASEPVASVTDLALRCLERTTSVAHVPALLYRARPLADAADDGQTLGVINRYLSRMAPQAQASQGLAEGSFRIDYPDDKGRTLIVIPTRDGVDLLRTCIDSIRRTTSDADIVVIDHESSKPETLAYLDSIRSEVVVTPYAGPFNFADMNNVAVARHADGYRYVVFMNNDIEAIEPGWLERMRSLAGRPDVGIVGATLLYGDRTVQHAGVVLGVGGVAAHGQTGAVFERQGVRQPGFDGGLVAVREYSAVTAACMMMRTDLFLGVGGYDEDLAVGFNDTDLCLRVSTLGYSVLNDPHAVLYHHESATRSQTDDLKHPGDALRFLRRWKLFLAKGDPFYSPLLSLDAAYQLADFTDMHHPARVRPVHPALSPLEQGRPTLAPQPISYPESDRRPSRRD